MLRSDTAPALLVQNAMSLRLQRELRLAAQFGMYAGRCEDLQGLLAEICRVAAEGLGATFAQLLVYLPDERTFVLQAGVGWRDGIVGNVRFDADVGTAAGLAWRTGHPIVCNDLLADDRFHVPDLLVEHGIVRSINVAVASGSEEPFGVLEVVSPEPGKFTAHDGHFLQLLSQTLAAAIGRTIWQSITEDHEMSCRELQHRVRNDLRAIHDNVDREERSAIDPHQSFERINRHVLALAALYDHLLPTQSDAIVDLGTYLHSLCDKIAEAAGVLPGQIAWTPQQQAVAMPVSRAVRLAIAVNELITNAAEHAYSDNKPGLITVQLLARDEDGVNGPVLTINDDGGSESRAVAGAGLAFVEHLARQAGAVLVRDDGAGTRWRMTLL